MKTLLCGQDSSSKLASNGPGGIIWIMLGSSETLLSFKHNTPGFARHSGKKLVNFSKLIKLHRSACLLSSEVFIHLLLQMHFAMSCTNLHSKEWNMEGSCSDSTSSCNQGIFRVAKEANENCPAFHQPKEANVSLALGCFSAYYTCTLPPEWDCYNMMFSLCLY